TLTGFWAIDEKPTGSKDPFALRRAALGVIRLVLENAISIHFAGRLIQRHILALLIEQKGIEFRSHGEQISKTKVVELMSEEEISQLVYKMVDSDEEATEILLMSKMERTLLDLLSFFHDRLKVYLRDQGIRHDVIDACIAMEGNDDLALLVARAKALQEVLSTEDGENLVQGFKRANNILTQAEEKDGVEYSYGADVKFAETEEEKTLFAALDTAEAEIASAMGKEDFATAMHAMAGLRAPIDAFFEAVQINTDNEIVRRNRLNLLSRIRQTCGQAADLTRIEG
ncbi:MAG: glycine--tRNA ligase subunit beta, partial [Roseovarius sp.]